MASQYLLDNQHNLHIGRTYTEYMDNATYLYANDETVFPLIARNGKHSKENMVSFAFEQIQQMNDWHKRYKKLKKELGYTNHDIAKITGNTYDSIKNATQPKTVIPRWLRLAIVIHETHTNKEESTK